MMIRLIIVLFLLTTSFTAVADDSINVAYPPFEPFYTFEDGNHKGICPDTVNKIFSDESGLNFSASALPLPRIMRDLANGSLDMAGCLPCSTPDIQDSVTVSTPYFSENMLVIFPHQSKMHGADISDRMTMQGVTVKDAITERYINPDKKFLLDSWSSVIQFIQKGRADYAVIPETIYNKVKSTEVTDNLVTTKVDSVEICMSISNRSPLVEKIEGINLKIKLLQDADSWMKHDDSPN